MIAVGEWPVAARVYHADKATFGHGMFEDFLENPRLCQERWVLGSRPPQVDTEALRFGRLIHTWLLEPLELEKRFFRAPDACPVDGDRWNRSKKAHKEAWGRLIVDGLPASPIEADVWDVAHRIAARVRFNPQALAIAEAAGQCEAGLRWLDNGVPCKSLRDKLIVAGDRRVIVDIKSMEKVSPVAFRKWAGSRALHRNAAWYLRGERAVYPDADVSWFCWAVSKETYESAIYELDPRDLEIADGEISRGLERLRLCRETGDWSAPWERGVTRVALSPGAVLYSEL